MIGEINLINYFVTDMKNIDKYYDVIVVGGGPSGMMAGISAASGTPMTSIKSNSISRVLIIEKYSLGGLCSYGMMGITRKWTILGKQIIDNLSEEISELGINVVLGEKVISLDIRGKKKKVITDNNVFYSEKVIIATGIFPYSRELLNPNIKLLTDTFENQKLYLKTIVSGLVNFVKSRNNRYLLVTNSSRTKTIEIIKKIIPTDKIKIVRSKYFINKLFDFKKQYNKIFIDYSSFKKTPGSLTYSIDQKIKTKDGYIVTDLWGKTNVSNVYACGNIVFPVSGVLQALYSGFVVGIGIYNSMLKDKKDSAGVLFPWFYSKK